MYRPRRTRNNLGDFLTLGGRIPATVGGLLLLIVLASLGGIFAPAVARWTALLSGTVTSGQVWRLVTWPFVQLDPMSVLFGAMIVWFFAPPLAYEWGERRLVATLLVITVTAALVTLFAGWLFGVGVAYVGIWPIVDALVILWALRNPDQQVLLYFVLPVTGRVMAWITVGTNALFLLWAVAREGVAGLVGFMPLVVGTAMGWMLAGSPIGVPRRWRLAWRDWNLERQARRRSRHLKVVGKDGKREGPNQWMN